MHCSIKQSNAKLVFLRDWGFVVAATLRILAVVVDQVQQISVRCLPRRWGNSTPNELTGTTFDVASKSCLSEAGDRIDAFLSIQK